MTIKEQVTAIFKSARYLPIQAFTGFAFLIIIPVLLFKGFYELSGGWTETQAKPIEISKIQERIRENQPDFFFHVAYEYGPGLTHVHEESFPSEFMANNRTEILRRDSSEADIWFAADSPNNATMEDPTTQWFLYFIFSGIFFAGFLYFRWLLIKYHQLELA